MFRKYKVVLQHDEKDCGPACLATICKQYGLNYPISKLREMSGTDKNGTSAYGLIQAAQQLGFTARGVKGNIDFLKSGMEFPIIAHVVTKDLFPHYIVIHSVEKNKLIVADPAKGMTKYDINDFLETWTGVLILLHPNPSFQQKNCKKSNLGLFKLLQNQRKRILLVFIISILYTAFGILSAFYFKVLLDDILPVHEVKYLHVLSISIILLIVVRSFFHFWRRKQIIKMGTEIDYKLVVDYYKHLFKLPLQFFGSRKHGEIVSRLTDIATIRSAVSSTAFTILIDTVMLFAGGIVLYKQNKLLFSITLLLVPIYVVILLMYNTRFESLNREQMKKNATLMSYAIETIKGIETIKANGAEKKVEQNMKLKLNDFLLEVVSLSQAENKQNTLKFLIQGISGILILWIGSYQVINGEISIGELISYNALLIYFLEPLQNLINLQPTLKSADVALNRLTEILDIEQEDAVDTDNRDDEIISLKQSIYFDGVYFRYGTRNMNLFDISLKINHGEKVAIVGESGSGKSTLVKLLLRFYNPESGRIIFGDKDITTIDRTLLRNKISYIPQENFFFTGTIKDNLSLGLQNNSVSFEKMTVAAKKAGIHDFITELPLQYNTILEEGASNLSGGQKQRLAIARALLREPDILIMDEATSNLDSITEQHISKMINSCSGITTIIVAHRLNTVIDCDNIFVLDKGKLLENGTHGQLVANRGKYFELWSSQNHDLMYK